MDLTKPGRIGASIMITIRVHRGARHPRTHTTTLTVLVITIIQCHRLGEPDEAQ
jgi:hypothetical protein